MLDLMIVLCWVEQLGNVEMGMLDLRGLKCWDLLDWNGLGNVGNGMLD